mgnify:CR=1 FL=1
MKFKFEKFDKFFFIVIILLILSGLLIFISASLGTLAKSETLFYSIIKSQLLFGLIFGLIGMYVATRIPCKFWKENSLYIFIGSLLLTVLVFIPFFGWSHGGASRWVDFGFVSFQPAEILKFGFVIYFSAWLAFVKDKVKTFKYGIMPFGIILIVIALLLLNQPDTKNFILITITGLSMLFVAGAPWKQLLAILGLSLVLFGSLVFFNPYIQKRVNTFINSNQDVQGASYQIRQSMIAIGSGGLVGRGYGQSIQKFTYLPEAHGDSIFAVLGEEFGFMGTVTVIILYLLFVLRGLRISNNSPDLFSRLLVMGIVILIGAQSFMHIASIIGLFPLTGVPLPFMSHGGTSLMVYLVAIGIVIHISKFQIKSNRN